MEEKGLPILYSAWQSSSPWRIRIILALKGIEYEYRVVVVGKDYSDPERIEYAKINPSNVIFKLFEILFITITYLIFRKCQL